MPPERTEFGRQSEFDAVPHKQECEERLLNVVASICCQLTRFGHNGGVHTVNQACGLQPLLHGWLHSPIIGLARKWEQCAQDAACQLRPVWLRKRSGVA